MRWTIVPMSYTRSPSALERPAAGIRVFGGRDRDKADAAVEGLGQVWRSEPAGLRQPDENIGQRPQAGIDFRSEPGGQNAADIFDQPAAGDMGEPPNQPRAMGGQRGGCVYPRRREERRPERPGRERRVVVPRKAGIGDDPPDQREAVRMNARTGQRQNPVAFPDTARR